MEKRLGDEDDVVEIACADFQPAVPSKLMQIMQEIELLKALSKSSTPISLEYEKFHICAKKINSRYCDLVIKSAWNRAIAKQRRSVTAPPNRPQASLLIDLTEPSDSLESSSTPPSHEAAEVEIIGEECRQEEGNIVPVALITNPFGQETESAFQVVNLGDGVINGVVTSDEEIIEASADVKLSAVGLKEEVKETVSGNSSEDLADDVENCNYDNMFLVEDSNSEYETKAQFDAFDFQSDSGFDSKDSGIGLGSKTILEKHKDLNKNNSFVNKIRNKNISKHHIGVPAKVKHKGSIHTVKTKIQKPKQTKFMSKEELKLFKTEQKKLKILEKRKLEVRQLEMVSNRLVDVLIPKYYKKVS